MKREINIRLFFCCFFFFFLNQLVYSQSGEAYHNSICTDVHCIYGGTYNLTFEPGSYETALIINMPNDISGILTDYNSGFNGVVGVYCGAYPVIGCFYENSSLIVVLNKGLDRYSNGDIVTLTIYTNKPYNNYPNGYYYIHIDLIVNK